MRTNEKRTTLYPPSGGDSDQDVGTRNTRKRRANDAGSGNESAGAVNTDGDIEVNPRKKVKPTPNSTAKKSRSNGNTSKKSTADSVTASAAKSKKKKGSSKKSRSSVPSGAVHTKAHKNSDRMEVMKEVPSMTKVKTFKPFPSFKAQLNDGTTAEFKKNQAVFVLPDPSSMKDPEGIPRQDEHWIGVIKEIRANSVLDKDTNEWTADPDDVWVVVEWFYKKKDFADGVKVEPQYEKAARTIRANEKYFGGKELIRSTEDAVVSVFSCCEPCPVYAFDDNCPPEQAPVLLIDKDDRDADAAQEELENEKDGDEEDNPNPLYAGPRNHFYRMEMPAHQKSVKGKSVTKHNITGLNIHCICATPYNPTENDSVQRYCLDCQKWFHERCLESWTEPIPALDTPGGEPPAALGELAKLPIARGDWWGIGGNCAIINSARSIIAAGNYDNWEDNLNLAGWGEWKEYVATMERTEWKDPVDDTFEKILATGFACPDCEARI